jgi:redox-sensing transcriptional repressor
LLPEHDVRIALLACRPQGLQLLVDRIARAGVKSFVNFVPKRITPPPGGRVEDIDIAARMEKLSFLAKAAADEARQAEGSRETIPDDALPEAPQDGSAAGS